MRFTSRRLVISAIVLTGTGLIAAWSGDPARATPTKTNQETPSSTQADPKADPQGGTEDANTDDSLTSDGANLSSDSDGSGNARRLPRGLASSSAVDLTKEQIAANPRSIGRFTKGFSARVVSASATSAAVDMMALWPNAAKPEWLIACNEDGPTGSGVERINIATGAVQSIVNNGGMKSCDGVRATPWGTVLVSEEAGGGPAGGRVYEILDPLTITGVSLDRATGVFSGGTNSKNIVPRPAMGRLSFEGFALYQNGVTYYGDELRPGTGGEGNIGGSYFKFVPTKLWTKGASAITKLEDSPFVAGSIYGLQMSSPGHGQSYGFGKWIAIPASADPDLRAQAAALKLAGFYRPEDGDIDRGAEANGLVRFCYAHTGNESADYFGEVICLTDGPIDGADKPTSKPSMSLSSTVTRTWPCLTTLPTNQEPATG